MEDEKPQRDREEERGEQKERDEVVRGKVAKR